MLILHLTLTLHECSGPRFVSDSLTNVGYSLGERIACASAKPVKITPQNGQPHIISGGLSSVVEGALQGAYVA